MKGCSKLSKNVSVNTFNAPVLSLIYNGPLMKPPSLYFKAYNKAQFVYPWNRISRY